MAPDGRLRISRSMLVLGGAAAGAAAGLGAAYRFALEYRRRAGLPHQHPIGITPSDRGLPFEEVAIAGESGTLPGWFIPAGDRPGPGVVVVHGWESNRGRTLTYAEFLHAAGFHCLVFDVRGHGSTPPETLPMTAAEFAADAAAAARVLATRPEVTIVGILGHSLGGAGAIIAASREPAIRAVAAASAPGDPVRLTRHTFTLAAAGVPRPLATPLAWLTARVFFAPRGRPFSDADPVLAATRYLGPLFLAHGEDDTAVPVAHLGYVARAARRARGDHAAVQTLVLPETGHRWLYERARFRAEVARFFAASLGGLDPADAARRAAECDVVRPAETIEGFGALGGGPRAAPR